MVDDIQNIESRFEQKFYVVFVLRAGFDEFEIEALFTKEGDAKEFLSNLEQLSYVHAGVVQLLPKKTAINLLVKDRIGAIGKQLEVLIAGRKKMVSALDEGVLVVFCTMLGAGMLGVVGGVGLYRSVEYLMNLGVF